MKKNRIINISIFLLSFVSLIISLKLFWNMGIYADEFNTSPEVVLGGSLWLYLDWVKLVFLALSCFLSGINIFIKNK